MTSGRACGTVKYEYRINIQIVHVLSGIYVRLCGADQYLRRLNALMSIRHDLVVYNDRAHAG